MSYNRILSIIQGKEVELLRNLGEIGTTFQKSSTSPLFFGEDTYNLLYHLRFANFGNYF